MSDDLDIDSILGVMEEAATAERTADYKIVAVLEREEALETWEESKEFIDNCEYSFYEHQDPFLDGLGDCDLILFECRLLEGLQDLKTIAKIRGIRPQIPILILTANSDSEFISSAYESGASDCVGTSINWQELSAKCTSLLKTSKIMAMFEFKNEEVIKTMRSLRKVNTAMKQEKMNRIAAETERDFAEEAAEANRQMKEILDHLREGFFFVNKDMQVGCSISYACEEIFGHSIAEKEIGSILNFKNSELEKHLRLGLEQIFDDLMPEDVSLGQLPTLVETVTGKYVDFKYTVVRDQTGGVKKVIIAASDISDSVKEKKIIEKRYIENRSLINILKHIDSFRDFIYDFRESIQLIKSCQDNRKIKHLLHTLKGNSLSFELHELGSLIHQMEDALVANEGYNISSDLTCVEEFLSNYLKKHHDLLKISYQEKTQRVYRLSEETLQTLKSMGLSLPYADRSRWAHVMDEIHRKEIHEVCSDFEPGVLRLAEKLGKKIDFRMYGTDYRIDADKFQTLMKSLIHLINNACDHGIEMPYDRLELGKEDYGLISLRFIQKEDDSLIILLSDDGKGIDWNDLLVRAEKKGFLKNENAKITLENAYEILFLDGFSTAENVSETSGRGIGMSALKAEVEALHGRIQVKSKKGYGTQTKIVIPGQRLKKVS